MFDYLTGWFSDPKNMLIFFLLAFPGRILALSVHEWAHAWMANRCGDPTAKMLGRMTLNPFKHLDLIGALMMMFLGYGWAKPVPVNPRNYRNYRWDDLKVSIAGVTMNFIMFIVGCLLMFAVIALAVARTPVLDINMAELPETAFRTVYNGVSCIFAPENGKFYYMEIPELLKQAPYVSDVLIAPVFGSIAGYLYDMLGYFVVTNLVLGIFNLLPVPPLDGYHVLNDLVVRRTSLFVQPRTAQIFQGILMVAVFTGALGEILSWVDARILEGAGSLAGMAFRAMGLM